MKLRERLKRFWLGKERYDNPDGWYRSDKKWTVLVHVRDKAGVFTISETFTYDYMHWFMGERSYLNKAEWEAKDLAAKVRKTGYRNKKKTHILEVHYPVHRIEKVEVWATENDESVSYKRYY